MKGKKLKKNKILITLVMSKGLENIFEDISATNGTPFVSGMNGNSTPINTCHID